MRERVFRISVVCEEMRCCFFVLILFEGDMRWLQRELIGRLHMDWDVVVLLGELQVVVRIVGVMLHLLVFRRLVLIWLEDGKFLVIVQVLALIIPQLWLLL